MKTFLERIVDPHAKWLHNDPAHSDCDRTNADAHLRAMLLGHSLTLQVSGGELVLGQWQRVLLAELDGPRTRSLRVHGDGRRIGGGHVLTPGHSSLALDDRRESSTPASGCRSTTACALFRVPGSARGRLARQPRAREAARRAHVLQLQPAARGDERLRGELPVLLVRAAAARRRRGLHDVARAGVRQAARSAPISRSPKSTSSTACIRICRSTTTSICCAG